MIPPASSSSSFMQPLMHLCRSCPPCSQPGLNQHICSHKTKKTKGKRKKKHIWCYKVVLLASYFQQAEFSRGHVGKGCSGTKELKSELSNSVKGVPSCERPIPSHRKLSSVATKENPLKALLVLALAVNSGVRLTELETISLVNSGSMCCVSAGPLCKKTKGF